MNTSRGLFYLRFPRKDCDALLAAGIDDSYVVESGDSVDWDSLDNWINASRDWIFGWIGYEVRKSIEHFDKESLERNEFPLLVLFRPTNLFKIKGKEVEVIKGQWQNDFDEWLNLIPQGDAVSIELLPSVSACEYNSHFETMQKHISLGNVYELNYCIPFQARAGMKDPANVWKRIYSQTEAPFSAYAQWGNYHVMCASPERYLKREGNSVMSQPIKGTVRRGATNAEDERLKHELSTSRKERAENVMIVDLVRNDLSRCAERDSVVVEELFGVQSFKTVHHLVSTIRCEVPSNTRWIELIRTTFPMGSMTGAPKLSAMKLIAEHERTERGVYSGSIGYIEPNGDFDFNVVIRSVQYDGNRSEVSCHVGGAITSLCNATDEHSECLLKAKAILHALRG
jgi:para-aminobenzoate synthetase component 1